jgi:hypothetical protein
MAFPAKNGAYPDFYAVEKGGGKKRLRGVSICFYTQSHTLLFCLEI